MIVEYGKMIVLLAALLLSALGYFLYAIQTYKLKIEFAPALFCAWCSNLLFLGGILNILPEMAVLLFAGGYILLALSFKRRIYLSRRDVLLLTGFFLVLIYFAWMMKGVHYTSYDNFSHWATVVKDMLLENRMPNFEDPMIRFQSYPLGSSLFIYYICKVIGSQDGCLLWAQLFMLVSFLFCMTVFFQKKRWYWEIIAGLFGIWALISNNSIYELRVDTLLPLASVAAFAVIYYYKDNPKKAADTSLGLLILLIQIKNSGIFFYLICILFLTFFIHKNEKQAGYYKLRLWVEIIAVPLFSLFLWKKHVAFVFPKGMESKHAMSLDNYGQVFAKKTVDDITRIGLNILTRFTRLENVEVMMMLVITLLVIAALCLQKECQLKRALQILAVDFGCLAAYTVSLYGMYLFSMPLGESERLASYDRYMLSVLIFIYGITVICLADCIGYQKKGRWERAGIVAVWIVMMLPLYSCRTQLDRLYQKPDFKGTKRFKLQDIIRTKGMETGDSCFIYCHGTDDDARYLFYLTRYELWSDNILVVMEKDFEKEKYQISNFDWFVEWDR